MKKRNAFLWLVSLLIFTLTSCDFNFDFFSNKQENNQTEDNKKDNEDPKEDVFTVTDETVYETTTWDDKADLVIKNAIGDAYDLIPHFSATKITFSTDLQDDGYGNTYKISVIEFHPVSLTADVDYEELVDNLSYVYSDTYACYLHKASYTDDLHLAFNLVTKQGHKSLVVESARFTTRMANWEPSFSQVVIGFDIPALEAESYEYYCDYGPNSTYPYDYYFAAYCTGYNIKDQTYIVTYKNALLATNKWTQTSNDSYGYVFTSKDGFHTLTIYLELDCYGEICLSMILESDWPLFFLYSVLGEDLPKLQSNFYDSFYYGIYDTGNTSYFGIYYTVESVDAYNSYVASMSSNNYSLLPGDSQGSYVSTDSSLGTIYYSYMAKTINGTQEEVDILYCSGKGQLAIIVY